MSTVITTATPEMPLRKRMRVLERASSLSSLAADAKIIPDMKHHDSVEDIAPSSFTDYESGSDTSGSENGDDKVGEEHGQPEGLEEHEHSPHRRRSRDDSSPTTRSRAWYEFDLAVVVALVSPVGNWLTGGDHIKHLLLIVLLILYLHQIIESTIAIFISPKARLISFVPSTLETLSSGQAETFTPSYPSTRSRIRRGSLCSVSGFRASQIRILLSIPHIPLSFSWSISPSLRVCFRPRSRCCFLV